MRGRFERGSRSFVVASGALAVTAGLLLAASASALRAPLAPSPRAVTHRTTFIKAVPAPGVYRVSLTTFARSANGRTVHVVVGSHRLALGVGGPHLRHRIWTSVRIRGRGLWVRTIWSRARPHVKVHLWRMRALRATTPATGSGTPVVPSVAPSVPVSSSAPVAPPVAPVAAVSAVPQPVGVSGGWSPVFDEEFNGSGLNTSTWSTVWWLPGMSLDNVSLSAANVGVGGGVASLTLSSSSVGAVITTNPRGGAKPGFQVGCGFVEGRVEFPGSGTTMDGWNGFWMSSQNWPATGEVDIFEGWGGWPSSNYHSGGPSHSSTNIADNSGAVPGVWGGAWHTFGVDREPGTNTVYWDGRVIRSYPTYDNCAPMFLIVSVGDGTGAPTVIGSKVNVDYIRAWTKS